MKQSNLFGQVVDTREPTTLSSPKTVRAIARSITPEARAYRLLRSHLTSEQRASLLATGSFQVMGSRGNRYDITSAPCFGVRRIESIPEGDRTSAAYCLVA